MNKTEKGITVIALVITIIVMLILTGVTVTSALNGGLFNTAKNAAERTKGELINENRLARGETISKYLPAVTDDWSQEAMRQMEDLRALEDGTYHIKTCAELAKFAQMVNTGVDDFIGVTVYLDANLNLQGNADKQWEPIGDLNNNRPFKGIFDGQNYYISGVYIETAEDNVCGLFGYIDDGKIKNLTLKESNIKGANIVGGIVGYVNSNDLDNPYSEIFNCYNFATVSSDSGLAGGVVGNFYGTILKCCNYGEIYLEQGDGVGGIVGNASFSNIKQCCNYGKVYTYKSPGDAGGICGWNEEGRLYIENCYNSGEVDGKNRAGGISSAISVGSIINSYVPNKMGDIMADGALGMITGAAYDSEISNCYYNYTGDGQGIDGNVNSTVSTTDVTLEYMKTADFVADLNENSGTVWKMDTNNINNGYPVFSWQ